MTRRLPGLALLIAIVIPTVFYLPTMGFGFLFDDRPLLIENPVVRSPRGVVEILTTDLDPLARTSEKPATNYLRPLFLGLASVLYALFGDAPRGWHATAILLHGLLAGLAYLILRREGANEATSLAAALLFAAHPSHVQSTAWVSGIQDLLLGVTALVAYLIYRKSLAEPASSPPLLLLLGLTFAVSLLAKEPAIALVLFVGAEAAGLIPAATGSPTARRPIAELMVLLATSGLYFIYRISVLGGMAHAFPTAPPLPAALASVPVALIAYAKDLFWPVDLFLLHPARPVSLVLEGKSVGSALAVLAVLALLAKGVRKRPHLARPTAWFFAWLSPVLALWAVNPEWMVMDRYLLIPGLGVTWALARLLPIEASRMSARTALWGSLILGAAALSFDDMQSYESEEGFWAKAITADPASSTAWTEWGRKRAEAGDAEAADDALRKAVALDPRAQLPRLRQALLALQRGDAEGAGATLAGLIERNPGYLPAWRNLVVAQAQAGDMIEAGQTLDRALERFPADPVLWTHKAILLRRMGRLAEALVAVRRVSALAPLDPALARRETDLMRELAR